MNPGRRRLAGLALGALAAATGACGSRALRAEADSLVELASGRALEAAELLAQLRAADVVLLGEQHDNPHHHARRGELVAALAGSGAAVVAEHLRRGAQVGFGADLAASLAAAGFDARGWAWPLHEPLFAALARSGLALRGGNLTPEQARAIARGGEAALPPDLAVLLAAAPLPAAAAERLDAALMDGHCGLLPARALPGLRAAQRARDAAMLQALQGSGGRPALLLAGNGHVRLDYGVGQLLRVIEPRARVLAIGFGEHGQTRLPETTVYTHYWRTPAVERGDPCERLRRRG